jgi:hypothetical protein
MGKGKKKQSPIKKAVKGRGRDMISNSLAHLGHMLGVAAAGAGKKKKMKGSGLVTSVSDRVVGAPLSMIPTIRSSGAGSAGTCRQRFSVAAVPVCSSSVSTLLFGGVGSATTVVPLDPTALIYGSGVTAVTVFGQGVYTLAGVYREFRLLSLSLRYLAQCPTSTVGSICIAYSPEGSINAGTVNTYPVVSGTNGNITFPVWQNAVIPLPGLQKQWLWTFDGATQADQRMGNAGSVMACWLNVPTATQTVGVLEFIGEIEFRGLGPAPSIVSPLLPLQHLPSLQEANKCNSFEEEKSDSMEEEKSNQLPRYLPATSMSSRPVGESGQGAVSAVARSLDVSRDISGNLSPAVQGTDGRWFIPAASLSQVGPR